MDAVKFLKTYRRICGSNACAKCPLWMDEHYTCMMDAKVIEGAQPGESEVVSAVEQWAKEHSPKTRQSVFLERYPNSVTNPHGVIDLCKLRIDSTEKCQKFEMSCVECHRDYWSQEVEVPSGVNARTNADKIRTMTEEELADFLYHIGYENGWGMPEFALEWLRQPAEEAPEVE